MAISKDQVCCSPKVQVEFTAETKSGIELNGTLLSDDIEFAAPIEGAFLFIRLGMLTDNLEGIKGRYHDMITDTAHAMQEYFQTVPFTASNKTKSSAIIYGLLLYLPATKVKGIKKNNEPKNEIKTSRKKAA